MSPKNQLPAIVFAWTTIACSVIGIVALIASCSSDNKNQIADEVINRIDFRFEVQRFDASDVYLITDRQTGHKYLANRGGFIFVQEK